MYTILSIITVVYFCIQYISSHAIAYFHECGNWCKPQIVFKSCLMTQEEALTSILQPFCIIICTYIKLERNLYIYLYRVNRY